MPVVTEAETIEQALSLPESSRAKLAEKLLVSLRSVSPDQDDGVAEALRRSRELNENPEIAISLKELDRRIQNRDR
jgi:hypothetical protein